MSLDRAGLSRRFSARYLTLDRRSLALARVLLGALLFLDLVHRAGAWFAFFADDGIFPAALAEEHGIQWSLFAAVGSRPGLVALFALLAVAYLCVAIGLHTKVAQVVAFIGWTSMAARLPLAMNAGAAVVAHLSLWLAILPCADRFSVDSLRASLARGKDRSAAKIDARSFRPDSAGESSLVTFAALGIVLQISAIYFINGVAKTGAPWRDLTAVHYVLHDEEFATPFAAAVRDHLPRWLLRASAAVTLVVERGVPAVLLLPFVASRRVAVIAIVGMHVMFGLFLVLGPFAWACCAFAVTLFDTQDWDAVAAALRRSRRARWVVFDERNPDALRSARVLARLDVLRLLHFQAGPAGSPLAVRDAAGRTFDGQRARAELVAALPLGPAVAWMFVSPIGFAVVSAARLLVRAATFRLVRPPRPRIAPASISQAREVVSLALIIFGASGVFTHVHILRQVEYAQPAALDQVMRTLNLVQGWELFAPAPFLDSHVAVVDAVTADGRHLDPFTGKPPRARFDGPLSGEGLPNHWIEVLRRQARSQAYNAPLLAYARAYGERTGRPEDHIVSARLYLLRQPSPPMGSTVPGEPKLTPIGALGPRALDP